MSGFRSARLLAVPRWLLTRLLSANAPLGASERTTVCQGALPRVPPAIRQAEEDVLTHCSVEEKDVLKHGGYVAAQKVQLERSHVVPGDSNGAGLHIPEPGDQCGDSRFACPRGAYEGDDVTRSDVE